MQGRYVHAPDGSAELQPYGQKPNEVIYSVSRAALNRTLVQAAEEAAVDLHFGAAIEHFDTGSGAIRIGEDEFVPEGMLIAADGAGSVVRRAYGADPPIEAREELLAHGYKELTIPADAVGGFRMRADALHVWPRGGFMLIALPNPGGDFTLTLFLAMRGSPSFGELTTQPEVLAFFRRYFGDVVGLVPSLAETFLANPTGELGTVRCRRWHDAGKALLMGDAAHAIVPFHGQGMNAAFEDCRVFDELMSSGKCDKLTLFGDFQDRRIDNVNAIADMALENYVEMRDSVNDPAFLLQKSLAFELERRQPDRFIPRYSMVMFHDEISYAEARRRGAAQKRLLEELTAGADSLDDIDLDVAERRVVETLPPLVH